MPARALDAAQSRKAFEAIEPQYRNRAKEEVGEVWDRMGEYQRAALVSATYKYWSIDTDKIELRTALENDLAAAMNGDDDWSETKNALKTLMADDPGRFDKTWALFSKTDEVAP